MVARNIDRNQKDDGQKTSADKASEEVRLKQEGVKEQEGIVFQSEEEEKQNTTIRDIDISRRWRFFRQGVDQHCDP